MSAACPTPAERLRNGLSPYPDAPEPVGNPFAPLSQTAPGLAVAVCAILATAGLLAFAVAWAASHG